MTQFSKKLIFINLPVIVLTIWSCSPKRSFISNADHGNEYTQLSMDFLDSLKESKSTVSIKSKLGQIDLDDLSASLINDQQRLTFWINIYNAFIQDILNHKPELYLDRKTFFREPMIQIAGLKLSFSDIEHGIIRRSQNEFGLGYLTKWFPPGWERKLRVNKRDYRVHFALNCGAKDCPPVVIYNPMMINNQLNTNSKSYLKNTTDIKLDNNDVLVTSLFSWFRGDFGGKSGSIEILKHFNIISDRDVRLKYKSYDWSLFLGNYSMN